MITAVGEPDSEHQTSQPSSPVLTSTYLFRKRPMLSQLRIEGMVIYQRMTAVTHNSQRRCAPPPRVCCCCACSYTQPHRSHSIRGQTESQILYEIKSVCSCIAALMLRGWPREVNGRYYRYVERIIASGVSHNALLRPECPPTSCFGLRIDPRPNMTSNESHGLEKSNQF
jgi:hypothetical protein